MTAPRVSVVMPAFNEAEILASSVRAVVEGLRARDESFEVLIVENGRPTTRWRSRVSSPPNSPKCASNTAPKPTTARALPHGLLDRRRRGGRELRRRFLRPRLPRRGGRAGARGRRAGDRRRRRSAARARPTRVLRCASSRRGPSARSCGSPFGLKVSDTHGMKAMRRAAVAPVRAKSASRAGPLRHRADPARRARRARHRGDPGRRCMSSVPPAARSCRVFPVRCADCASSAWALWKETRAARPRLRPYPQRRGRRLGVAGVGRVEAGRIVASAPARRPATRSISVMRCSRPGSSTRR